VIYIKQCFGSQGVQHKGELKTLDDDDDDDFKLPSFYDHT
jgi:hypothetical protein